MFSRTQLPRPKASTALIFVRPPRARNALYTQSLIARGAVTPVWPISWNYCPFWPARAVERYTGPFNKKLANKVLIANNRVSLFFPSPSYRFGLADERNQLDAATPLKGAQALSKIMGDNAALVVQEGIGVSRNAMHTRLDYSTFYSTPRFTRPPSA